MGHCGAYWGLLSLVGVPRFLLGGSVGTSDLGLLASDQSSLQVGSL